MCFEYKLAFRIENLFSVSFIVTSGMHAFSGRWAGTAESVTCVTCECLVTIGIWKWIFLPRMRLVWHLNADYQHRHIVNARIVKLRLYLLDW